MPCRRLALAAAVAALALPAAAASAPESTGAAYLLRVNALCRSYTPTLHTVRLDAAAARRAGDVHRLFYDLGYAVALALREDHAVEAIPVPETLQTRMAPILVVFKRVDGHAQAFIDEARANKLDAAFAELKPIATLSAPTNRMLDRVGLPDCGSRQS